MDCKLSVPTRALPNLSPILTFKKYDVIYQKTEYLTQDKAMQYCPARDVMRCDVIRVSYT